MENSQHTGNNGSIIQIDHTIVRVAGVRQWVLCGRFRDAVNMLSFGELAVLLGICGIVVGE